MKFCRWGRGIHLLILESSTYSGDGFFSFKTHVLFYLRSRRGQCLLLLALGYAVGIRFGQVFFERRTRSSAKSASAIVSTGYRLLIKKNLSRWTLKTHSQYKNSQMSFCDPRFNRKEKWYNSWKPYDLWHNPLELRDTEKKKKRKKESTLRKVENSK